MDKVLFHFYIYVHKNQMIHLPDRISGLTFKHGILNGHGVDCFSPAFTSMLRLDRSDIVGKNARNNCGEREMFGTDGDRTVAQQHATMNIALNENCGERDSLERKVIGPTSSNVRMRSIALNKVWNG